MRCSASSATARSFSERRSRTRSRMTAVSATMRPRARLPHSETMQLAAELGVPARDLGALDGVVRVVQLFNLGSDSEDRLAPGKHFAAQEAGALADLLDERPVKERIEGLPVVVELGLEAGDPLVLLRTSARQRPQVGDRRDVVLAELGQALAINRGVLALGIEKVVADEDARQVHVGPQPAELGLDVALVRVELVELSVDLLRPVRRREYGHDDQQEQPPEAERRDRPGPKSHW